MGPGSVVKVEDLRPGDVVEIRQRVDVARVNDPKTGFSNRGGWMWFPGPDCSLVLVSREDKDAEARVCAWAEYRKDYAPNPPHEAAAHKAFVAGWQAARESVRRAES